MAKVRIYHMSYIFMDESGDLGFNFKKKKTSRYFIMTFVFTAEKILIDRIVNKIFKGFSEKEIKSHNGVLHAYKEKDKTIKKLLNLIVYRSKAKIIIIYFDKSKVYTKLDDQKHILYNILTNMLIDRLYESRLVPSNKTVRIIASRRETSKFLNSNFKSYLKNHAKGKHNFDIQIDILPSYAEKGLQVADLISWSIFRKYEYGDNSYYDILRPSIIKENGVL